MTGDWAQRADWWIEALGRGVSGLLLGGALCRMRPLADLGLAAGRALGVTLGAVWFSQITDFWFPWAVIAGGQVPCALVCSLVAARVTRQPAVVSESAVGSLMAVPASDGLARATPIRDLPEAPDYELFDPPFCQGAYGKVWLARNAIGQWPTLKAG